MEPTTTVAGREPPSIRYRGVPEPTVVDGAPARSESPTPPVIRWLTWAIFAVVMSVWAVVGAVVWIPLILRAMVRFSFALVQATLDGERPTEAGATLQGAVDFYRRGFILAHEAVFGAPVVETATRRPVRTRRLFREFLWAAFIWYLILALFGVVWGPVEIWNWFTALPWDQFFIGVGEWIAEPFVDAAPPPAAVPGVEAPAAGG